VNGDGTLDDARNDLAAHPLAFLSKACSEEVTGNLRERLVRDRLLAANVEPAIAGDQTIEPFRKDAIGNPGITPEPQCQVTRLL
jgi:hypothetical protein